MSPRRLLDRLLGALTGPRDGPPPTMPDEFRAIHEVLRQVMDPELNIDVVSLGLIRAVSVTDRHVDIQMTLTRRSCPIAPMFVKQVEDAVAALGYDAKVELVFDPPWSKDDVDPEYRNRLG